MKPWTVRGSATAYGRKGESVVAKNMKAVDETLAHLHEVKIPAAATSKSEIPAIPGRTEVRTRRPGAICAGKGDELQSARSPAMARSLGSGRSATWGLRSRMGFEDLHPVRQMRHGLPARRHQGVRQQGTGHPKLQVLEAIATRNGRAWSITIQVAPADAASAWISAGEEQAGNPAESDQHGAAAPIARTRD